MFPFVDRILERLLLRFCKPVHAVPADEPRPDVATEIAELFAVLPELPGLVRNQSVLDFGCGLGAHSIGMAMRGAMHVTGVDINETFLARARDEAPRQGIVGKTSFVTPDGLSQLDGQFDLVLSYNSMEHFSDPLSTLREMRRLVRPGGRVVISFSPPWYSAYGAHFAYITPIPWVHFVFPERTLMRVRTRYRNDGATRFEDIEGGLNRMSVRRYFRLLREAGLEIRSSRLIAMRGLPLVTRVPGLRELATTRVVTVLAPVLTR